MGRAGRMGGLAVLGRDGLTQLATLLKTTPQALMADLKAGKTIAQIAQANGVDVNTLIATLENDAKTEIQKQVTAGHLTQEQATKIENGLATMITDLVNGTMPHFAFGFGLGGPGPGGVATPGAIPPALSTPPTTAAPTPTTAAPSTTSTAAPSTTTTTAPAPPPPRADPPPDRCGPARCPVHGRPGDRGDQTPAPGLRNMAAWASRDKEQLHAQVVHRGRAGHRNGAGFGADAGAQPRRCGQRAGRVRARPASSHQNIVQQALSTLVGNGTITQKQSDAISSQVQADRAAFWAKRPPIGRQDLAKVAFLLGLDAKTLRTDLRSGQTIAQVATAKGINPSTLAGQIVALLEKGIDARVARAPPQPGQRLEHEVRPGGPGQRLPESLLGPQAGCPSLGSGGRSPSTTTAHDHRRPTTSSPSTTAGSSSTSTPATAAPTSSGSTSTTVKH